MPGPKARDEYRRHRRDRHHPEREAIGERTRDALWHKRTNGERVGNIRFGFRLSPDGKHVERDPGEQGVLTEIGHQRQSGYTMPGIAAALNCQSLRTAVAQQRRPHAAAVEIRLRSGAGSIPWALRMLAIVLRPTT